MRIPRFTPAERQVVRLISLGLSTREVAYVLGKAESTVDNQRTSAMRAARITTATELVRVALLSKVTTLEDKLQPTEKRKLNVFRRTLNEAGDRPSRVSRTNKKTPTTTPKKQTVQRTPSLKRASGVSPKKPSRSKVSRSMKKKSTKKKPRKKTAKKASKKTVRTPSAESKAGVRKTKSSAAGKRKIVPVRKKGPPVRGGVGRTHG